MITSVVTGLFTDNATLKLKEVFDTLFKPKDDRSGALNTILSITGGKAEKVAGTNNVTITLTGSNMSKNKFSILVNNEAAANPKITDTSAVVVFDNTAAAASAHVVVDDDAGKSVFDQQLNIV
jgi:archaellum component FlaF (FlaF/FlaG flagellin family)